MREREKWATARTTRRTRRKITKLFSSETHN